MVKGVALSALARGISSGLATAPLFKGAGLDKLLLRSTVGNVLTQGVGVVTGLQSSFSWRGVAASAAGAVASQVAGKLLGDVVDTASWDPWAKEMVTRTGAGLAAGTVASIAQGGRVSMQQVATDAFGNALGWSVAGTSGVLPPSPVATSKYPWLTEMNQWSSLPRVKVAELGSDFSPTVLDSASPSYALPTLVVRPSGSEWSNPFADSGLASVQWTISSITNAARSSPQEANWSFREASMAQRKLDDAQALVQYRARLANGPSMSAWDGVVRQSPIDTYLTQARGGLDVVRGEQWGMRVAQSLPDAVINEVGGLGYWNAEQGCRSGKGRNIW
ncbi:hypothetical protein [Delftia acidovorans]|uniref:hypothetical protein n=1 Tax=Delftia acidovorans TaxID=80866 RepID=UPI001ED96C31|nr:hypothetical protein [Delftia acidovorans]